MCAEGETIQVRRLEETQLNPPDNRSEAKGRETEKTKRHKTQDDKKRELLKSVYDEEEEEHVLFSLLFSNSLLCRTF